MPDKLLYILLEGDDDERFFKKIVKPLLQRRYSTIKCWKYSQKKHEKIILFIKSLNSMEADYIFASDINNTRCIIDLLRNNLEKPREWISVKRSIMRGALDALEGSIS